MAAEHYSDLSWDRNHYYTSGCTELRLVDVFDTKLPMIMQSSIEQSPLVQFCNGKDALPSGLVSNVIYNLPSSYSLSSRVLYTDFSDPEASVLSSREDDTQSYSTEGHRYSVSPTRPNYPALEQFCHLDLEEPQNIDPSLVYVDDFESHGYQTQAQQNFEIPYWNEEAHILYEDEFEIKDVPQDHVDMYGLSQINYGYQNESSTSHNQSHNAGETVSACNSSCGSCSSGSTSTGSSARTSSVQIMTGQARATRRRCSISSSESSNRNPQSRARVSKKKKTQHVCPKCPNQHFRNKSELRKHTETRHTKPYICIFNTCRKNFGARNEWKRHIATQHLQLSCWKCDDQKCRDKSEFNRKDLFTKHLERMHKPHHNQHLSEKAREREWRKEVAIAQARCEKPRSPPQCCTCGYCGEEFNNGDQSWSNLIDHVGRHYQHGHVCATQKWTEDQYLNDWKLENKLITDSSAMEVDSPIKHEYSSPPGLKIEEE